MKKITMATCLVLSMLLMSGCFTTKVYSKAVPTGPEFEERQWFLVGGLVDLTPPAGRQCKELAYSESKMGAVDVLINLGLSVAGSIAAVSACDVNNTDCRANLGAAGSLLPWLFGTRTVKYQCGPGGMAADAATPAASGDVVAR